MRTDGDGESRAPLSRRTFVAAAGANVGTAMVGGRAAAGGSTGSVRVAATEPYRRGLQRAVTAYRRTRNDRDVEIESAGANADRRLHDGTLDVFLSGRPSLSTDDATASARRFLTVTGWAALRLPDDCWWDCVRQEQAREYWDGDTAVESWSESDRESVATVARTGPARAKRGETAASNPVPLVRGTRAYQYARGFGGLGHYVVEDGVLDRTAGVQTTERQDVVPLVRLGYVHADEDVEEDDIQPFLQTLDRRADGSDEDVAYFRSPAADDATGQTAK